MRDKMMWIRNTCVKRILVDSGRRVGWIHHRLDKLSGEKFNSGGKKIHCGGAEVRPLGAAPGPTVYNF